MLVHMQHACAHTNMTSGARASMQNLQMYVYIHTYIHVYIHTYIYTYMQAEYDIYCPTLYAKLKGEIK